MGKVRTATKRSSAFQKKGTRQGVPLFAGCILAQLLDEVPLVANPLPVLSDWRRTLSDAYTTSISSMAGSMMRHLSAT